MPIPRRNPVVGVGWLSSSNEDLCETEGDGGNGGRVEIRSSDVGRDFTAIRDEEREGGGEKDAIVSAICVSLGSRRVVFSPSISRRALRKASFSCFRCISSSSVSARIRLSVATMLFA